MDETSTSFSAISETSGMATTAIADTKPPEELQASSNAVTQQMAANQVHVAQSSNTITMPNLSGTNIVLSGTCVVASTGVVMPGPVVTPRPAMTPGATVKYITMQDLMRLRAATANASHQGQISSTPNQISQLVRLATGSAGASLSLGKNNVIIGNRIIQCVVSQPTTVVSQPLTHNETVAVVQKQGIKLVQQNQATPTKHFSIGAVTGTPSSIAPASGVGVVRMSAVLPSGLVRTLVAGSVGSSAGVQQLRPVITVSGTPRQQKLLPSQPGSVTVQIVRPPCLSVAGRSTTSSSVASSASSPIQCLTSSQVAIAALPVAGVRMPNSAAVQARMGLQQKKIVLVANPNNSSSATASAAFLTNSSSLSQNKIGQQLPITLLATPNSGTGNVRYIAIRGTMPSQISSTSSSTSITSTAGVGTSGTNVAVTSQPSSATASETSKIIQAKVIPGSTIQGVQQFLQKAREQQQLQKKIVPLQNKSIVAITQNAVQAGLQQTPTRSLRVIQQQQPSLTPIKTGSAVQLIDQRVSGSQGATIYIITNNNSTSTLTPMSVSGQQQLIQTKALSVSSSASIRPKIVAIRPGGHAIQVVTRNATSDGVQVNAKIPVFVDGQNNVKQLSKAQQNQKKANKIIAEAIAKAQAEGLEVDTSELEGKRKRKRKGETTGDEDQSVPTKKKRESKPRGIKTPRRGGKKMDDNGCTEDGMEVALEDSELTIDVEKAVKEKSKMFGKSFKKKKRPLPTFLRNKKKRKAKDESDISDVELITTPVAFLLDGEDSLQTRRSSRVVKRKKYVDEVDLGLSDDHSGEDDEKPSQTSKENCDLLTVSSTPQQVELYEENPSEEDAQIVEKILGVRVAKRKLSAQVIEKAENDAEVDVEMNEERSSLSESLKEIEVEEFYVKYKNYSFLHCEWRTADELAVGDKRILMKIKRFKIKRAHAPFFSDMDEDELFNPDYVEVDRILDKAVTIDPVTNESVTHYLVTWRSLPYEDATWELEQDVEQNKVDTYLKLLEPPTEAECQYRARPTPREWRALSESTIYKNENTLREYQLEGLNWLTFSYNNRQNCILADEMGLGKTIQSITFLQLIFENGIRGPFLIIVPLSTVGNWQREFEAWTDINVIVYHGSMASRNMLRQYEMYYLDAKGAPRSDVYKFHVLITTYEVIISDFDELSPIDWRVAVIDEAHRLKNRNCKLLQGLTCFELEHRVLLTGTPLQNNVDELFSLLSFLEPRQFCSSEAFLAEFGKLETESQVDKLKALLKPMMLRRLKEDVEKSLAPKEETIVEVELTNIQKKYYRAILERNFSFLAKGGSSANLPNLMNTMMELRKCCNHPYLVNGAEDQILEELVGGRGDPEKLFQAMIQSSGKLVLVDKLLPKLKADGHKVLVFSQMIRVLDIIEDYLIHKHYAYERIDGRIRGNLRQEAIDRFSKPDSDRFVFLLCTRAGGLGINLTAADTVIIFDSDWNPQNDLQAQARCHRIGQLKSVKVYRLITRNTYEREMFDRASLKLGLDKAVLQSTGNKDGVGMQNQLSKKEIEDLLKKGAYGALMDDDNAAEEFCEEDIEHILKRRTKVIQIEAGVKGSTFAKASFNLSTNRSDINLDDPNFWQKWARKVDLDLDDAMHRNDLIVDLPRQRKVTARYGKQDNIVNMSELDTSNSDSDEAADESLPVASGRKVGKRKKKGRSRVLEDGVGKVKTYTRSDCFKVEKNLLVYGWGRWPDILLHGRFKHKLGIEDIITITRAMLMFSLQHYEGDERIKKFIYDLISPNEDGLEKDYKNHTGLSAPVPRGRKGKKVKKDSVKKQQFDEDLTKLDIDINTILIDDGYKKHLKRQSNKVLLRVRLLYYLKQEVIGRQAEKIFNGAHANEIDVPILCGDVDIPVYWWDAEADRCLLVGVFKHGYEKYNQMRQDSKLCFLGRCGPPDSKALLAEQNDDDDIKDDEDEEDLKPRKRGRRKKSKKSKKDKEKSSRHCNDDLDDTGGSSSSPKKHSSTYRDTGLTENGKLPFPSASDLNTRFRRIITSYQRSHKQGMLKLEQVAKKMHRREHMKEGASTSEQYMAPSELQSMHLEGIGGNPLLLAEQLNWTRREEADFYRVVSTFGVERDCSNGQFIWDNFRNLGRLERKLDDTLTEYFKAFYHMCMKVCDRFKTEEEARPPNGIYVMPITAERANRCLARIDLLSKIREQILWHPHLNERLVLCQPSSYFPDWWICGLHDKDLLVGAAKHGVSRTDYYIQKDPQLSFSKISKIYAEQNMKDETMAANLNSESLPSSPREPCNSESLEFSQKSETKVKIETETSEGTEDKLNENELSIDQIKSEETDEKRPSSSEVLFSQGSNENASSVAEDGEILEHKDVKEELDLKETPSTDGLKNKNVNDEEESGVTAVSRCNYQWPKDRIVIHRLENICHCIEMGRWKVSQRHHGSSQPGVQGSDPRTTNAAGGTSLPGTPVGGGHDYTIVTNPDEQNDSFKFKLQKRRHRRTKAEIGSSQADDKQMEDDVNGRQEANSSSLKKKRSRKAPISNLDSTLEGNEDPEAHVSVVNQQDGSRLSGDEAPTRRQLEKWLEEHPEYVVEKQLLEKNCQSEMSSGHKYHRRPRFDPSKLTLEDLTGDENVTVINRNTGKRITGAKAPPLRHLQSWLIRNPGFDIDPKWGHIVRQMGNLSDQLSSRFAVPSTNSQQRQTAPTNVVPGMTNEEIYKRIYMAQMAAMAEGTSIGAYPPLNTFNPIAAATNSIYAAHLAGIRLLPPGENRHEPKRGIHDDDSSSESHDSSPRRPSTSAFMISPSATFNESYLQYVCDPNVYGAVQRSQVEQQKALQSAGSYPFSGNLQNDLMNRVVDDTDSDVGDGIEATADNDGVALSDYSTTIGSSRVADLRTSSSSLGPELVPFVQTVAWNSSPGSRLKTGEANSPAVPRILENFGDSSDSSEDEFVDD